MRRLLFTLLLGLFLENSQISPLLKESVTARSLEAQRWQCCPCLQVFCASSALFKHWLDFALSSPVRYNGGNVDITAWIVGEPQEHGWMDSYLERGLRGAWGGFLCRVFCVVFFFFSSVKSFWCVAAQHDVLQSGGQQAACTIRGHLRDKTLTGGFGGVAVFWML